MPSNQSWTLQLNLNLFQAQGGKYIKKLVISHYNVEHLNYEYESQKIQNTQDLWQGKMYPLQPRFTCLVCSQHIWKHRRNYGGQSCNGCRVFFRRIKLSNLVPVCRGHGVCPLPSIDGNMCTYCRYQKCLRYVSYLYQTYFIIFFQYWNEARIDKKMGFETASGSFLQTQKVWTSLLQRVNV